MKTKINKPQNGAALLIRINERMPKHTPIAIVSELVILQRKLTRKKKK